MSLPVRECGLKYNYSAVIAMANESLPVRECGLKSCVKICMVLFYTVTPCAGVWIEIMR